MDDVTVIVATYGDSAPIEVALCVATFGTDAWRRMGLATAMKAAAEQHATQIIISHGATLAQARNHAIAAASTEWVSTLDADDSLSPGYFDAMEQSTGDLRAPAISWVSDHSETEPVTLDDRDIVNGLNPCCIGTLIRREMFWDVGGFWDEPAYEDYSLFRRAHLLGAHIEHVPGAVYRAHVRPNSRNQLVRNGHRLVSDIVDSHSKWLAERQPA